MQENPLDPGMSDSIYDPLPLGSIREPLPTSSSSSSSADYLKFLLFPSGNTTGNPLEALFETLIISFGKHKGKSAGGGFLLHFIIS